MSGFDLNSSGVNRVWITGSSVLAGGSSSKEEVWDALAKDEVLAKSAP
jgi:hypothetical protein